MPLYGPPLPLFPAWSACCCAFKPLVHCAAMFQGWCGQNFGGGEGVLASSFSPSWRRRAHLNRGCTAWFLRSCLQVVASGQGSKVSEWCARTSSVPRTVTITNVWRLRSVRERGAVSSSYDGCPACSGCTAAAHGTHREVLRANCDSRTWGDGRRNCQAAKWSLEETTDRSSTGRTVDSERRQEVSGSTRAPTASSTHEQRGRNDRRVVCHREHHC